MIHSIVGHDGSARVELDGETIKIRESSVDAARDKVHALVIEHAAQTGIQQFFRATDPLGTWPMYVFPDGRIVPAPADVLPPLPRPMEPEYVVVPTPVETHQEAQPVVEAESAEDFTMLADLDHTVVAPRQPKRPEVLLHLESGETVPATAPIVVGRRPAAMPGHTPIAVKSPRRETSRTHLVIDVDDEQNVIVTDQGSPNGTYCDEKPLAPHTPTVVPNGARIQLGDVVIRVEGLPANQRVAQTVSAES